MTPGVAEIRLYGLKILLSGPPGIIRDVGAVLPIAPEWTDSAGPTDEATFEVRVDHPT